MGKALPFLALVLSAAFFGGTWVAARGVALDVLAPDEDTSRAIMAKARYALLHTDFPGPKCISGNLAIPFSPSDMPVGMTYGFNVWHTMEIDNPLEPFPVEMVEV